MKQQAIRYFALDGALEDEQRELERKQKTVERESYRDLQQIFERAVREGRAKRER